MIKQYYTTTEFGEQVGLSSRSVIDRICSGEIAAHKPDKRWLIPHSELKRYAEGGSEDSCDDPIILDDDVAEEAGFDNLDELLGAVEAGEIDLAIYEDEDGDIIASASAVDELIDELDEDEEDDEEEHSLNL